MTLLSLIEVLKEEVLGGVEIGNGTIRVKIPLIDKVIELDTNDLTAFRETLTSK